MYLMFVHKDKMPSEIAGVGKGEITILRAFLELYIEEKNKEAERGGV